MDMFMILNVAYDAIVVDGILGIHENLTRKHDIK